MSYGRLIGSNDYGLSISALNNNVNADILLAPKGGNVGINTDNPQTELDVNGDIIIQGVKGAGSLATDANGKIIAGTDADGPWDETSGLVYPKDNAYQVSIGCSTAGYVGYAKLRVFRDSADELPYFWGGGSRGLQINDVTEGNAGDHTRFSKSTASGEFSFSNSTGELVRINKDGDVTFNEGTGKISAGEGVFTGMTTHEAGVSVTGGTAADVGPGIYKESSGGVDVANEDGSRIASFKLSGRVGFPDATTAGLYLSNTPSTGSNTSYGVWANFNWSGVTGENVYSFYTGAYSGAAIKNFAGYQASGTSDNTKFDATGSIQAGFWAKNTLSSAAELNAGFYSDVSDSTVPTRPSYNFFALGAAPNYFKGGLTLGGLPGPEEAKLHIKSAGSTTNGTVARFDRSINISTQHIKFVLDDTANYIYATSSNSNSKGLKIVNESPAQTIAFSTKYSTSQASAERMIIEANGAVKILNLAGNGDGYVKVNNLGTLTYSATRTVAAGEFAVQLDSDDPANFQSVYVTETDEDGNEVQTQEQQYTGTTEDLLSIIKDLRARIEELESNTLQPLYQTVADLPDASEHHGKTAHVHSEGALYFAHAGNWVKLQNA